jgi:hypothetical protein
VTLTPTKKAVISTTGDDKKVATIHMYIHMYMGKISYIVMVLQARFWY